MFTEIHVVYNYITNKENTTDVKCLEWPWGLGRSHKKFDIYECYSIATPLIFIIYYVLKYTVSFFIKKVGN